MIIALYIVAFAMVGGGLAALVQGLPYIMVERGWAMVIAGTVAVSGGAVLAGIAVSAGRLGRIQDELASLREGLGPLAASRAQPAIPGAVAGSAASTAETRPDSVANVDFPAGELGSRATTTAPVPALTTESVLSPDDEATAGSARPAASEAQPEPPVPAVGERASAALEATSPAAEAMSGETPPPTVPDEPAVIGTYSSGGNSYVMFSDGSIQAETPNGLYRFKSLDELKDFIAAGGESQGAARA